MPKRDTVSLSTVISQVAAKRDRDATKEGKRVRGYIRSHDAELRSTFNWPPESKGHKDGNRYPEMPRACATHLRKVLS